MKTYIFTINNVLFGLAFISFINIAQAQIPEQLSSYNSSINIKTAVLRDKLIASDTNDGFLFSRGALSIDGNRVAIGSYGADNNIGAVYIFESADGEIWTETDKLIASDGITSDFFGSSVGLYGNTLIVGARGVNSEAGAAYIFDFDGMNWTETIKISASDAAAGDRFGVAVSLFGNIAVVGAEADNSSTGAVYIYAIDNLGDWVQTNKLTASDAAASDAFGSSVSLNNTRILVGASGNDDNGISSGSAYIFDLIGQNWIETIKLIASDAGQNHTFGKSVSLFGNHALVGADGADNFAGAAYMFELDMGSWTEVDKLTASDADTNDYFGAAVALSDTTATIGAYGNINSAGSAYAFNYLNYQWVETEIMTANDGVSLDYFGLSVAVDGEYTVIGAPFDNNFAGSAYVFYTGIIFTNGFE